MPVEAAAALARRRRRRRGVEPIRIVILPQVMAPATGQENWDDPVPTLF